MSSTDRHHEALNSMLKSMEHGSRTIRDIRSEAEALLDAHPEEFIIPGDSRWPGQLADLGTSMPAGLWVRGEGTIGGMEHLVTVEGSSSPTDYGKQLTDMTVKGLREAGKTIVASARPGVGVRAIEASWFYPGAQVPSVLVLSGGFTQAAGQQLKVSLCPPGTFPSKSKAHDAKLLLAALSGITVVVESDDIPADLETAHLAATTHRRVAAFPGSVFSGASRGAHRLIREGRATLVTGSSDVLALGKTK